MTPSFPWSEKELSIRIHQAVASFWSTRTDQAAKQKAAGVRDTGNRGQVTGGRHLHALGDLLREVAILAGFTDREVRFQSRVELPGFYRPTKSWDMIVLRDDRLCAAVEMKSQVGSFRKNFNNRSEEALGNML